MSTKTNLIIVDAKTTTITPLGTTTFVVNNIRVLIANKQNRKQCDVPLNVGFK